MQKVDVIIIGAGAAGLMCAIEAGKRGRRVVVLDHANKVGKKILMSGGGRCNFTNYYCEPNKYISHNPHFCKSALARYTQWDFIELVKRYQIPFHEKTLGQLFCDNKAKEIVNLLLNECELHTVTIVLNNKVDKIIKDSDQHFIVKTNRGDYHCQSLVIATGGLSIPTMGASPFAYHVAEQFNIKVWATRAGLVPFTLQESDKQHYAALSGIGLESEVSNHIQSFRENILFTHRGLSGPAILQISSYWNLGETVNINLFPDVDLYQHLKQAQQSSKQVKTILTELLPERVVELFLATEIAQQKISALSNHDLVKIVQLFSEWTIKPHGTEGYRTAEVTLGGIDCDALSSKTMEVNHVKELYFIGEAVDVTGWLGGYNFQWAWSSGWSAGQVV